MAKKQPDESEKEHHGFFEFAIKLWKDGSQLKSIRKVLGLSKKEFAERAGISKQKLNGYERSGEMAGNFWLFCSHLRQVIIRNPVDWEAFLNDPNDRIRPGGKINKRDKRYGKPSRFWRWAEDAKKDEMSRRTGNEIPREDVEQWHEEWKSRGKPDGWGREESRPIEE